MGKSPGKVANGGHAGDAAEVAHEDLLGGGSVVPILRCDGCHIPLCPLTKCLGVDFRV